MKLLKYYAPLIGLMLILAGCDSRQSKVLPEDQSKEVWPHRVSDGYVDTSTWLIHQENGLTVHYPLDWQIMLENRLTAEKLPYTALTVKSTDKQPVVGALAPDDYRKEDGAVNTDKYAEKFAVFTVDVYDLPNVSWHDFYQAVFGDSVTSWQVEDIPELGLQHSVPQILAGAYPGDLRFQIYATGRYFDVAVYAKGVDHDKTMDLFNVFMNLFINDLKG